MSTKNLARTVIEGGRANRNKWDRRQSNATMRAAVRVYEARLRDPEVGWSLVPPTREKVYRGFTDRLGPVYRWLDRHCGRPWTEVRAEIFRRFDTRRLAGRHIVFDHMLREVLERGASGRYWTWRYLVDERGLLQPAPRRRFRRRIPRTWLTSAEVEALYAFASVRKIRKIGTAYFWLEMTFIHRWTKGRTLQRQPTRRYRQTRGLTDAEVARFLRMNAVAREILLDISPSNAQGTGGDHAP